MRIIAGSHRHRKILPPRDAEVTRPVTDRVKQSIFDRLWSMGLLGDSPLDAGPSHMVGGGNVLDMFAGTGSLGLEALSRGADHCTFIEKDRTARMLLERNLKELGFTEQAAVMGLDALGAGWLAALPQKPLRLVFCDPPYALSEDSQGVARLASMIEAIAAASDVMECDGALLWRTSDLAKVPAVTGWNGPEQHSYGAMAVHWFIRKSR